MDQQLVIYYLKRHLLGIVGLLLAGGFVAGGFVLNGKFATSMETAKAEYEGAVANRDKIQNSSVKVDSKNVAVLRDVAKEYTDFVTSAGQVFGSKIPAPMNSNDYLNYMVQTIALLNEQATNNLVRVPNDLLTRADLNFSFTFAPLMTQAEISEDKIPELQVQMEDIKNICQILFDSRIQSIEQIQRNRVTTEDRKALANPNYLDTRQAYTNSISVVRPYRVKFRCLSNGIAKTLSGFAKQDTFYVVRTLEVTPAGASTATGGDSGMDSGMGSEMGSEMGSGLGSGSGIGMTPGVVPGMGSNPGGATQTTNIVQSPAYVQYLVRMGLTAPPATNVVKETLLEVVMDLDSVRRIVDPEDEAAAVPPGPAPVPAPPAPAPAPIPAS